jgi:hypothetical protein
MATSRSDNDSSEFPAILSDEEFEAVRKQRERIVRSRLNSTDITDTQRPPAPTDGRPESTIEQRFPHVAKMLVAMWPSEALALYVKRMMVADRETRAGFPRDVIEDLLLLDELNDMLLRKIASREPGPIYTATDRGMHKP